MTDKINFVLQFPQGGIVVMKDDNRYQEDFGAAYFIPTDNAANGFLIYGQRKEFFGKHAISVERNDKTGAPAYNFVFEFNDNGVLTDARLLTKDETVHGTIMAQGYAKVMQDLIDTGKITLHGRDDSDLKNVFNAASFPDGRLIVQLRNRDIYLGTPGNFQKLETTGGFNAGGGTWRDTVQGDKIALPYGLFGPDSSEDPMFNDQKLTYLDKKSLSKIDFKIVSSIPPVGPFSPQLKDPKRLAPKGPAR